MSGPSPAVNEIVSRRDQYLVAPKPAGLLPFGVEAFSVDAIQQTLREDPEIEPVRTIAPRGEVAALSEDAAGAQPVMVARMPEGRAAALSQMPQLIVEHDVPLHYGGTPLDLPLDQPLRDPGTLLPFGESLDATFVVHGVGGVPLAGAQVYVFGRLWPFQGSTDAAGRLTLSMFGERADTLAGLYVKPKADYWSIYVDRPQVEPGADNVVSLPPLGSTLAGFPDQEVLGWGSRALRVDKLPPEMRGKGVKVAVVDSGAAGEHGDLARVARGLDMTTDPDDPQSWKDDTIGHGSHCAGVISGALNGRGIVGIAPEADVFVYKIFPGGRASDLIDALQRCIDDAIDVVNLSLGSAERSQLLEQKIRLAKQMGVACVAAAGNSAGPVQHPASVPEVLAVAALGKEGEFPPESYHARQVAKEARRDPAGYFSAKFTCFGPEVDVCAPGVGIVSAVPPNNYAAWDGTSMAAPHVTGLAALVLAHHPDFKGPGGGRNAQRVERLFELIKRSATPMLFGDPNRTGAGMPDAPRALGLEQGAP
ncbi:MAG TPA: S8 family serine peptidase, partial [Solirubrobacteraceae bacterium]|nr:S8 family serine peptidase [Solirubrobacteraceae bacterium]